MIRFTATIFLSAFLLFQVQPMLGKYILPWFGGGPGVWSACLLFFQALLLGGYTYTHLLTTWLSPRKQAVLHVVLLLASLVALPITPAETWKPVSTSIPALRILLLLAATVGAPYLLVSSTSPLLQYWFGLSNPGKSPYRLYAVSNIGSLLGLLAYPFVVEPTVGLQLQTVAWSVCYGGFVLLSAWCAFRLHRDAPATDTGAAASEDAESEASAEEAPTKGRYALWLALPACGSLTLLATTNQVTQDISPGPFLWVLPLALYLLSFIICFDRERWYDRRVWTPLFVAGLAAAMAVLLRYYQTSILGQAAILSANMFVCCMVCHGELVRLKPGTRHLTAFYLMVSLGGACGGVFVSLIAPAILNDYWEFHLGLLATYVLFGVCLYRDQGSSLHRPRSPLAWGTLGAGALLLIAALAKQIQGDLTSAIALERNFYGKLTVREYRSGTPECVRYLCHGDIKHGGQLMDPKKRRRPITYYGPDCGLRVSLDRHPARRKGRGLRIGVTGLGAGTVAALARKGDRLTFYEINPIVVRLSDKYFTYRKDSRADVDLVMGDARLSMERQLAEGDSQQYDILALDAFSSDAIPVHLLTLEAVKMYWQHLKPDGILGVHISNNHLDLVPVARALADAVGKRAILIIEETDHENTILFNKWVMITDNQEFLNDPDVKKHLTPWDEESDRRLLWTDDYSNLLRVLR